MKNEKSLESIQRGKIEFLKIHKIPGIHPRPPQNDFSWASKN
jgi:hypothetical protein